MDAKTQLDALRRGVVATTTEAELSAKLARGKPLRVKLGVDPTAPDLHLGHTVVLRKLRQFQDLGHRAVLIVGDFTALIGDPSGRDKTRPTLTREAIEANAKTYLDQAAKVLDSSPDRLEVVYNSRWLRPLSFEKLLALCGQVTVARFLERDDFSKRHKEGVPIGLHEFLYPIMQGYDSVEVRADVELGGTDQTFNLMAGRDLQRSHGQEPQVALTLPILVGLDGARKMSKSYGNHIGVSEDPDAQYGKAMSIPDAAMKDWFTLVTGVPLDEAAALCDAAKTHPRAAKDRLAREVVRTYHGEAAASAASERFVTVRKVAASQLAPEQLSGRALIEIVEPGQVKVVLDWGEVAERQLDPQRWLKDADGVPLPQLLLDVGFAESTSKARALISQGGIRINGVKANDVNARVARRGTYRIEIGKKGKIYDVSFADSSEKENLKLGDIPAE